MQHNCNLTQFQGNDSWVILSGIEQNIKKKIESVGIPLKDWEINIYRGILTGFNDAFIISSEKRDEILCNCISDEERSRTAEIIRPILRGRDIKRFEYDWPNLWLINVHNGVKGRFPRIMIENYPAIKRHLDSFGDKLTKRADQGDTPYNLRNCAYLEDFSKPKILWKRIGSILRFSYDVNGCFGLDSTCFLTGKHVEYLTCVLNSQMGRYLLQNAPKTGTGDLLISVQAVEPIRIPLPDDTTDKRFKDLLQNLKEFNSADFQAKIDNEVWHLYRLTTEEIHYISSLGI